MKFGRAPTTCRTFILNSHSRTGIYKLCFPFCTGLLLAADG
jgi:hypothetical protein